MKLLNNKWEHVLTERTNEIVLFTVDIIKNYSFKIWFINLIYPVNVFVEVVRDTDYLLNGFDPRSTNASDLFDTPKIAEHCSL